MRPWSASEAACGGGERGGFRPPNVPVQPVVLDSAATDGYVLAFTPEVTIPTIHLTNPRPVNASPNQDLRFNGYDFPIKRQDVETRLSFLQLRGLEVVANTLLAVAIRATRSQYRGTIESSLVSSASRRHLWEF